MSYRVGNAVRLRPGPEGGEAVPEAAGAVGVVGDSWTDARGERVSVVYEAEGVYLHDRPASAFVRHAPAGAAPR